MATIMATHESPRLWVVGDLNGFFGLFTNVALNVIVLTGLCLGVVKLPDSIVFFVSRYTGSMTRKTTMNMCGTLGPYGIAVTSPRRSFLASRQAR